MRINHASDWTLIRVFIFRKITESIQTARLQNISLKYPKISVFYEATQQKYAIKKFISEEEHSSVS